MLKVSAAGAALGFLGAVGIYFEPQEPYPGYITLAGTLGGITIALLIKTVVTRNSLLPSAWAGVPSWACWQRPRPSLRRGGGPVGMLRSWYLRGL